MVKIVSRVVISLATTMADVLTYREPQVRTLYRGTQIVWYLLDILEVLLLFRLVMKLLAANPQAGFTRAVYSVTYPFVAPFIAVFRNFHVASSTFEWTTLLAMFVYWLIAWGIVRLITMARPITRTEADYKLNRQDIVD
jgi:ABC-type Na+ efflux pump permease subunit